jgi:hypothetical protein
MPDKISNSFLTIYLSIGFKFHRRSVGLFAFITEATEI